MEPIFNPPPASTVLAMRKGYAKQRKKKMHAYYAGGYTT
jgi:hypothetical protein